MRAVAGLLVLIVIPASGTDLAKWTSLGPDGGWITALVIDPHDPATVYAGTRHNGVFKTSDGGTTWNSASAGLPDPWVWDLKIDPQNTSTLYVSLNSGVFKTTDAGATWLPAGSGLPYVLGILAVDPQHPGTVYAAPGWNALAASGPAGVYKTTDGGVSWAAVNSGLPINRCWVSSLAIDPQAPNTVYAACLVFGSGAPLYKTTDGGASWRAASPTLPQFNDIMVLAIDPNNSNLYAGTGGTYTNFGIWKSIDGGSSWAAANSGLPAGFTRTLGLAVDPEQPGTLYAVMLGPGSPAFPSPNWGRRGGVFKSTDSGENWNEIDSGLMRASFDPLDGCSCDSSYVGLAVDPHNPDTVFVGSNGEGVFKSSDGGAHWTEASSGLRGTNAGGVVIDPKNSARLYAATTTRVYKSLDSGTGWTALPWWTPNLNPGPFLLDPHDPDTMYVGTAGFEDGPSGSIYKTVDGGKSWRGLNSPDWGGVRSLTTDPDDSSIVYAGTDQWGVYRSRDGGETWVPGTPPVRQAHSIAVDPKRPDTIYAGLFSPAPVFKSMDGGATWAAASTGLPSADAYALAIDPQNPDTIYAGLSYGGVGAEGVYKSVDGGGSWSVSSSGLPLTQSVTSLAIDPRNSSLLYAATNRGVFESADGGASWKKLEGGPRPGSISFLTIDPHDSNQIYASGNGGGFRIDLSRESAPIR
jgi:photosystem II stability/assembly factor-like uncharacterized protein